MNTLANHEPGPVSLSPNRFVYYTGKVAIGLRHEPRQVEQGSHALMWQRLFTTEAPREWEQTPREFYVSPSIWRRIHELAAVLRNRAVRGRV